MSCKCYLHRTHSTRVVYRPPCWTFIDSFVKFSSLNILALTVNCCLKCSSDALNHLHEPLVSGISVLFLPIIFTMNSFYALTGVLCFLHVGTRVTASLLYYAHIIISNYFYKTRRSMIDLLEPLWTLRAPSLRSGASRTNVLIDSNAPVFKALQDELVRAGVPPASIPMSDNSGAEALDKSFSQKDFDSTIAACRVRSSPGLKGVSYDTLCRFLCKTRSFTITLFNYMFLSSSFPTSWRSTYVIFIPKPRGKGYRPILLTSSECKWFERLIHHKL